MYEVTKWVQKMHHPFLIKLSEYFVRKKSLPVIVSGESPRFQFCPLPFNFCFVYEFDAPNRVRDTGINDNALGPVHA